MNGVLLLNYSEVALCPSRRFHCHIISSAARLHASYISPPSPQCLAVEQHPTYWVGDYGIVGGADKMKAEIYARGPIGCGIDATSKFEKYTGGIYSEKKLFTMINHEVSVSNILP